VDAENMEKAGMEGRYQDTRGSQARKVPYVEYSNGMWRVAPALKKFTEISVYMPSLSPTLFFLYSTLQRNVLSSLYETLQIGLWCVCFYHTTFTLSRVWLVVRASPPPSDARSGGRITDWLLSSNSDFTRNC